MMKRSNQKPVKHDVAPGLAEQFNKPGIPIIDLDTGQPAELGLRTIPIDREIQALNLSPRLEVLNDSVIDLRNRRNDTLLSLVMVLMKLDGYSRFWTSLGFPTKAAYLQFYGLPDEDTLGRLQMTAGLVNRTTFVIVGHDILLHMIKEAINCEPKDKAGRHDYYKRVLSGYRERYGTFNLIDFYDRMRRVFTKKPSKAKDQGGQNTQGRLFMPQVFTRVETVPIEDPPNSQSRVTRDVVLRKEECPTCRKNITAMKALVKYILILVDAIIRLKNKSHVPVPPSDVKEILAQAKKS